jgi:dsDNA-specific endonuclease/ATPase MutS2
VRQRLSEALHEQFSREIGKSGDRVRESIAPYSRFVRSEGEKLRTTEEELREIGTALASLQARVERRAA